MSNKVLSPNEAREVRKRATRGARYSELRDRLNKAVSDPNHKPNDLITVKDFPEAVVTQIVDEFRKAGWNVSSPYAVEDGDLVITIKEG